MIGTQVGSYVIERELGEGGMSHVYVGRALHATTAVPQGFPVVLKVMSEELSGDTTARKRFIKEADILSKLRHRYITRFYEFLNSATGAVLVMEFVEGTPVDLLLADRGSLPVDEAVGIAQCLLDALVYAHGKGVVHRDIKPANLIREKGGAVKVTDFGIAKIREAGAPSGQTVLTKSGFLLGTPHYMSPEQIREPKDAGPRSDVYSSGVVLYEMVTGALPFNSRSLPKLIDAIYRGDKPSPAEARKDLPPELERIILKAMEPRMELRFASALEFFEALEEFAGRRKASAPRTEPAPLLRAQAGATTAAPPRWALVHVKPEANERHAIGAESVMVGRDRGCTIVLPHPAVSRKHARITISGPEPVLEDLRSANGTYVNNARVERVILKPGDVVRFGADPACSYVWREH